MSNKKEITHNQCVAIAANWLSNQRDYEADWRCQIVMREPTGYMVSYGGELPDVLGMWGMTSTNIECKVSRSDFIADSKKLHNHPYGNYKIYACPHGLIKPDEIPENWGLLYVDGRGGRLIVKPKYMKSEQTHVGFLCDLVLNACISGDINSTHLRRPKNKRQWDGKAVIL